MNKTSNIKGTEYKKGGELPSTSSKGYILVVTRHIMHRRKEEKREREHSWRSQQAEITRQEIEYAHRGIWSHFLM